MGMIGAAFGLGFTFGPMIGGIMSRISYSAPFYFAAGLAVANAVLVYLILPESLSREHRARPHEDAPITEVFRHGRGWMFSIVVATFFFLIAGPSVSGRLGACTDAGRVRPLACSIRLEPGAAWWSGSWLVGCGVRTWENE